MQEKKYDGLTISSDGRFTTIFYNISEALEQDNPRNVFLNGQLFIEMQCDMLLGQYFCSGDEYDTRKRALFSSFLKTEGISYSTKIKLMKTLEYTKRVGMEKLIDPKILTSLKAIGAVRNAFQHNLEHEEALNKLTTGDSFVFLRDKRSLSSYNDVEELKKDFASEAYSLNSELHDLAHRMDE